MRLQTHDLIRFANAMPDDVDPLPLRFGEMPTRGRLFGVDYGTKRIGLATCDAARTLASPLEVFESKSEEHTRQQYVRILRKWQPLGFVVGLPLHVDGRESAMSRRTREHARWLHKTFALPCVLYDERYTSQEAEASLWEQDVSFAKRKQKVDAIAACVMLQNFLDVACQS